MKQNLLISTLWEKEPVISCLMRLNIQKLVLLVDNPPKKEQLDALEVLNAAFKNILDLKTVQLPPYDIYECAKRIVKIIDTHSEDNNIHFNLTGGRKTTSLSIFYAASSRPNKVTRILYVTEENSELIDLPILHNGLSKSKIKILGMLDEMKSVNLIAEKVNNTKSMIYTHIREMRDNGYLDGDNHLTSAGKLAIL